MDPELATVAIRWAWLAGPATGLAIVLALRPPGSRAAGAALVATAWCLPTLVVVNLLAQSLSWWHFHAEGGLLLGMPFEALLGWSLLWGALPALLLHRLPLLLVLLLALWIDVLAMPRCAPVLTLGPHWLVGELLALVVVLLPALVLARLTRERRQLPTRAALQAVAFGGITFFLLPAGLLEWQGLEPFAHVATQLARPGSAALALLALPPLVLALSAVVEFATRGGGTPLPLDPPERLVTTGPYAFVRNPMQLGATCLLLVAAAALSSAWLALAAGVAVVYSMGLAAWDEAGDLQQRHGANYARYRAGVRSWWPRWRPYRDDAAAARLFFAAGCGACEDVARFVRWLRPEGLELLPAQDYERPLLRLTYRDGEHEEQGLAALARALEHGCLPLALLGCGLRLPLVRPLLQLVVDASGGHARPAPARPV